VKPIRQITDPADADAFDSASFDAVASKLVAGVVVY
jgi:hypothetical protein